MLLMLAVATVGFAAYYVAELATAPMRTRRNLVHRAANYGRVKASGKELPKFRERVFTPLTSQVSRLVLRVNPKASTDSVAKKLMAAGMRNTSPNGFIAAQGIFAIGGGHTRQDKQMRLRHPVLHGLPIGCAMKKDGILKAKLIDQPSQFGA